VLCIFFVFPYRRELRPLIIISHSLESPCLGHLHGDPSNPEELNCHAFTASAQLLTPDLPPDTPPICAPGMKDPAAILNRLLALSPEICSDTDITPIQMWNRIRQQPHSGSLALQKLRTLAEKLRDAAKCHGYVSSFPTPDAQVYVSGLYVANNTIIASVPLLTRGFLKNFLSRL
jgi:hypothetical protein